MHIPGTEFLKCLHAFVHKVNIVRHIKGMIKALLVPDVEKENESCGECPKLARSQRAKRRVEDLAFLHQILNTYVCECDVY